MTLDEVSDREDHSVPPTEDRWDVSIRDSNRWVIFLSFKERPERRIEEEL